MFNREITIFNREITIFNRKDIDSIRVHFAASYVRLPECTLLETNIAPEHGWLEY